MPPERRRQFLVTASLGMLLGVLLSGLWLRLNAPFAVGGAATFAPPGGLTLLAGGVVGGVFGAAVGLIGRRHK